MRDSLWFTTRSALFQGGDAAWQAVAAYAQPLERLLARRYPWLRLPDREDLVHDLLVEVHEKVLARHDPGRGRFRALLQSVVQRRVVDLVRRRAPAPLADGADEALAAPAEAELVALDVEAALLEAVSACRDRFTQGADADPDALYALADRIVHGRSSAEIARKDGVSLDRVNRLLRKARDEVQRALLCRELDLDPRDPSLGALSEAFREALRRPGDAALLLERAALAPGVRERMEDLLARFRAGVEQWTSRPSSEAAGELLRGLSLVLEGA